MAKRFANDNQRLDYEHNVTPAGKAAFQAARDRSGGRLTYAQWKAQNAGNPAFYGLGGASGGGPAAPAGPPGAPPIPPHLTPEQQAQYNQEFFGIQSERIGAEEDWAMALANDPLVRAQIDLQYRHSVRSSGEGLAERGVAYSGIADSAFWDVQRVRELAEIDHQNALDSAKRRYDATMLNLNQRTDALGLWQIQAMRSNAAPGAPGGAVAPPPPPPAPPRPSTPAAPTAKPPGAGPPSPNHWWTGSRWVPIGRSVPASHGQFASGPPPGPDYAWNGTRWVKVR